MNKVLIFIILLLTILSFLVFSQNKKINKIETEEIIIKTRIAACPTYYEIIKNLDSLYYEIILTNSTSESIKLLERGDVDVVFGGRTLRPEEPQLDYKIIKEGYSFLSDKEIMINENNLKNNKIFTDLDIEKIKESFEVNEIFQVNNVYEHINKGIIITSWENTDYLKAKIVHLLKNNGERVELSRRPTIYCPFSCDNQKITNLILSLAYEK